MPRPLARPLALLLALAAGTAPALADAPLFILDRTQLPFELGPGHPANNPAAPANSPYSAWNSAGNSSNTSGNYENRPSNPANQNRLIITSDGSVVGYYALNPGGVLNLFDVNGNRVAFRPARGSKSLFTTNGQWCGTTGGLDGGGVAFGITQSCAARFFRN
ncbi:hypothetical protein MLD63_09255 [Paracoccus sp. TK19116]|uniref:Uncharacterized protein n=1 Tax=Paracoccus albicereus TaxID=2922394 RepID=A0ABT1MSA0_9RHOB|nr:hypothetical protein [Paracoccus albicereus]MCQ0970609.1 hypothetical protein [Paracoccus albicereus]